MTITETQVRAIWMDLLGKPNALTPIARKNLTTNQMVYLIKIKRSWTWLTDALPPLPLLPKASNYPRIEKRQKQAFKTCTVLSDMHNSRRWCDLERHGEARQPMRSNFA